MIEELDRIKELNRKIDEVAEKTTISFNSNESNNLNKYDYELLVYYNDILDLLIEISKKEKLVKIEEIDKKYFDYRDRKSVV